MTIIATIAAMTLPELLAVGVGVGATEGLIQSAATGQDIGKGMLMGAGTGLVTAGVGAGVGGLAGSALTGALGDVGAGAVIGGVSGAAGGAAGSAMKGEGIGKGALMGGATGAVLGGAGGALAGAPGATGTTELAPGAPASADIPAGPGVTTNALPELGKLDSGVPIGGPNIAGPAPATTPTPSTGALDSIAQTGSELTGHTVTGNQLSIGLKGLAAGAATDYAGNSIIDAQDAAKKASQQNAIGAANFANQNQAGMANLKGLGFGSPSGPLSSLSGIGRATGGLTALAHGGQVPLKEGAYIIPADVVSALGNGSTKAGAEFLRHLMIQVRKEAVKRQGLGAAKNHAA